MNGSAGEATPDVPDYPMSRSSTRPLAPPPRALALGAVRPLSRVRIWDGSTPWLVTGMISLSVLAPLEHPDQLALWSDTDDPKVIVTAVEELLRYLSIIQTGQRRVAIDDIEIAGEVIRAGEGIILDIPPANWDARQYANADQLDLQRQDNAHVGFGYGRHQCVGQQLARMELQIVLPTLLRRIPTLRWRSRRSSCRPITCTGRSTSNWTGV